MDEVWDVNWFGSTKTLDVHVSSLRRKLGDDSAAPRYIHTVRGVGFRFAAPRSCGSRHEPARAGCCWPSPTSWCVVIVALEVPLALNLSRRVDAEIKSEAQGQAQLLAAERVGPPATSPQELDARPPLGARPRRPRDRRRRRRARCWPTRPAPAARADAPTPAARRSRGRWPGGRRRAPATATRWTRTCCSPPCRCWSRGGRAGAVRVTQSVDAVQREVRNDVIALIGVGAGRAAARARRSPGSWPARSRAAARPGRRRAAGRRGRSRRARRGRGVAPSSARWPPRSTT